MVMNISWLFIEDFKNHQMKNHNQKEINLIKHQIDMTMELNNSIKGTNTDSIKIRFPLSFDIDEQRRSYIRVAGALIATIPYLIASEEYEYCNYVEQILTDNKKFMLETSNKAGVYFIELDGENMSIEEMLDICDQELKKQFEIL